MLGLVAAEDRATAYDVKDEKAASQTGDADKNAATGKTEAAEKTSDGENAKKPEQTNDKKADETKANDKKTDESKPAAAPKEKPPLRHLPQRCPGAPGGRAVSAIL